MTDKELQQAVNRLNMEERYKQVMTQRHNLEKGEDKVTKMLNISGNRSSWGINSFKFSYCHERITKNE